MLAVDFNEHINAKHVDFNEHINAKHTRYIAYCSTLFQSG